MLTFRKVMVTEDIYANIYSRMRVKVQGVKLTLSLPSQTHKGGTNSSSTASTLTRLPADVSADIFIYHDCRHRLIAFISKCQIIGTIYWPEINWSITTLHRQKSRQIRCVWDFAQSDYRCGCCEAHQT